MGDRLGIPSAVNLLLFFFRLLPPSIDIASFVANSFLKAKTRFSLYAADSNPRPLNRQLLCLSGVSIGGSVVECSPATRAARVRFPADATFNLLFFDLLFEYQKRLL